MFRSTTGPRRPGALAILGALFVLLALPGVATADAELVSSDPADGATVQTVLERVVLVFDEAIFEGSAAALRSGGASVPGATSRIDDADPTRLLIDVPVDLPAGEYEVRWNSVARDGHGDRGSFSFTYAPPEPTPEPTATPLPTTGATAAPTPTPTAPPTEPPPPTPTPSPTPAEPSTAEVMIPVVAGLALVGGLAFFLLRDGRRSRANR